MSANVNAALTIEVTQGVEGALPIARRAVETEYRIALTISEIFDRLPGTPDRQYAIGGKSPGCCNAVEPAVPVGPGI